MSFLDPDNFLMGPLPELSFSNEKEFRISDHPFKCYAQKYIKK